MQRDGKKNSSSKYGKLLAVALVVALTWGLLLMIFGIYFRFKFGTLLTSLLGDSGDTTPLQTPVSDLSQALIPVLPAIPDDVEVGDWKLFMSALIMAAAATTMIFAGLGIFGGLNHSKIILYITIVFLVIATLNLIFLISFLSVKDSMLQTMAKDNMKTEIDLYYTMDATLDPFVTGLNAFMLWFKCCGISGDRDFKNLTYIEAVAGQPSKRYAFKVPPACCVQSMFKVTSEIITPYTRLRDCAVRGYDSPMQLYSEGCFDSVMNTINGPASAILILMIIWNVLVLLLAILTIMEITPEEERQRASIRRDSKRDEMADVSPVKKFVPYAKISSFTHADLSRVRSTEIW